MEIGQKESKESLVKLTTATACSVAISAADITVK